jgi:lysozyme family protein
MNNKEQWRQRCSEEIGKPYIWGAEGPDAYDCSGFVQWALRLLNMDPSGDQTAEGLYRFFSKGRSRPVEPQQADLGDLVFFGTEDAITHVALAWGVAQMLEAGGGGRKTTSAAIARQQGAAVRIRPINRRKDLVAILRPDGLQWQGNAELEAVFGYGRYTDAPPLTEWLDDGRHMQLKRPFGYVQENGNEWPVPTNAIVDGASIPRVFWSLIGGPFEGLYRNASIVHDFYCDERSRPWRQTHQMFYDGIVCSGVEEVKAKILYYAVYRFGPRWSLGPAAMLDRFEAAGEFEQVSAPLPAEAFDPASFEADASFIIKANPDLDAIELLANGRSVVSVDEPPELQALSLEAAALAARRPLLERLVNLQEGTAGLTVDAGEGDLLSRYNRFVQDPVQEGELEAAPLLESLKSEYEMLYASCQIRPEHKGEVAWHRQKLLQYRACYESVAAKTGAPWWFIGIVHALEASFNFNGHLHNGDPLSGRTIQVPRGRPPVWNPPNDWESSAIDAINYQRFGGLTDWDLASALYRWESYNGWGYHPKGIHSPYLWSFSNHYTKGKFVQDGKYDPDAVSRQCGAAVMLRALQDAGIVTI